MELNHSNIAIVNCHNKGYRIDKSGEMFNPKGIRLKKLITKDNYYYFGIKDENRKSRQITYHRFQAYQKYGNEIFKDGIVTRHKNGIRTDNSWDNILIGSQTDNILDITSDKRILKSANSTLKTRKYSNEFILEIKNLCLTKTPKEISILKDININDIYYIRNHEYLFQKIDEISNGEIKAVDLNVDNLSNKLTNYSDEIINEIKLKSINKSNQELSDEFNISKAMITYLLNK